MTQASDNTSSHAADAEIAGMKKGLTSYGDQGCSLFLR